MFDHVTINQLVVDARNAEDQVEHNRLFTLLLGALRPVLLHACRRRTVPGTDIEDGLQVAAMAVLTVLDRYDPERGNFVPFVREVVLRRLANTYHEQVADKRATLGASLSLDVGLKTAGGRQTSLGAVQAIDADRRPHLATAIPTDGLSATLARGVEQCRHIFWCALRERLSPLEQQVLNAQLRGDTPAETASEINYAALPPLDAFASSTSTDLASHVDASTVSTIRAGIIRKSQQLDKRLCPGLRDRIFLDA
ncbi:MAG: sigma-70 family RNA polymerase sigma factor [Planctomycetes bacterium]|nr:sigma-70 family RNA polymerase sigma factor [Planctomycetota bacterium]